MRFRSLLLILLLIVTVGASGADINGDNFETILLPIAFFAGSQPVQGAFGTLWGGEVWMENRNNEVIQLFSHCNAVVPCLPFQPRTTGEVLRPIFESFRPEIGFLFHIRRDLAANISFSNRIFEQTMRTQPRGVQIPVVREGEFFSGDQTILGVPGGHGVRTALRVYDPWIEVESGRRPSPVLEAVKVLITGRFGEPLGAATLYPQVVDPTFNRENLHKPGFAAIPDLALHVPAILDRTRIHVRLTPVPSGAQYWAMVSVTDNATQTVSIITAQ